LINSDNKFINFEILWVNNKLYLISNFIDKITECIEHKYTFIIIPVGIEMPSGSHANYIIYDVKNNIVERFEPNGSTTPVGLNYNPELLDSILKQKFIDINPNIKYLKPQDYLPKVSFQMLDIMEHKNRKIGDPGGFCALWAIWYVDMRLTYNTIEPTELVFILINAIRTQNISVKNMIRNYAINIISDRDNILTKLNLDMNDWINDKYTTEDLDNIINELLIKIKNI